MKGQLGSLVHLTDTQSWADIAHYGSSMCHTDARSVMAAEVAALLYAFDHAFTVK